MAGSTCLDEVTPQAPVRGLASEISHYPGRAGYRNRSDRAEFIRAQESTVYPDRNRSVRRMTRTATDLPVRPYHLNLARRIAEPPGGCRSLSGQYPVRSAGEGGRHPECLVAGDRSTQGVYRREQLEQLSGRVPVADGAFPKPCRKQLLPAHDPVLGNSKGVDASLIFEAGPHSPDSARSRFKRGIQTCRFGHAFPAKSKNDAQNRRRKRPTVRILIEMRQRIEPLSAADPATGRDAASGSIADPRLRFGSLSKCDKESNRWELAPGQPRDTEGKAGPSVGC